MRTTRRRTAPRWRSALLVAAAALLTACGAARPPDGSVPRTSAGSSADVERSANPGSSSPLASSSTGPTARPVASARPDSPTVAEIARLTALVTADPRDGESQRALGFALLQRVRETADPSLYGPATAAFEAALDARPDDALALVGIAGIQLGKHEFGDGLASARKAIELSPSLVPAHAAEVDALIELGRYDEADTAAGLMFGLSSDLTTLARVSYLAELRGQLPVALAAMRAAAAAPGPAPENTAYVEALLGNLLVFSGDPAGAAGAYEAALAVVPDHAPSLAGQARLAVGSGSLDRAIALFGRAADIVPLPEYVIALGDAQSAAGHPDDAARSYGLARAEIELFKAAGVVVDVDLALLEADHGDPAAALAYAESAAAVTPTVRASDAVAWALHRLGRDREALTRSTEARRLGSLDPLLLYHAGAIEAALGDVASARRDLEHALRIDPGFSATGAAEARRILATLP